MVERNGNQLTSKDGLIVENLLLGYQLHECNDPEEAITTFNERAPFGLSVSMRERDGSNGERLKEPVVYKPHAGSGSPSFTLTPGIGDSSSECCTELDEDDRVLAETFLEKFDEIAGNEHELKPIHATPHHRESVIGFVVKKRREMPISRILSKGRNS